MYKTCAFYTFFSRSSPTKALVCQRCIISCISDKSYPTPNPCPAKVHFFACFLEETLC